MLDDLVNSFDTATQWRIIGLVVAFYCVAFVLASVVRGFLKKEYVVDGKLSISNTLQVLLRGLEFPIGITFVGVVAAGFLQAVQDPPRGHEAEYWEPYGWLHVFTGLVIAVQILIALALVGTAVWFAGRSAYRYLLRPAGRGISRLYHSVRPHVPVRW